MLKPNIFCCLGLLMLMALPTQSQTRYYQWAHGLGSDGFDQAEALSLDKKGNLYVTGTFSDTIDLEPGSGRTRLGSPSSNIRSSLFLQKLDTAGNLKWARAILSEGSIRVNDLLTDGSGNIYFTGSFKGDRQTGRQDFGLTGIGFEELIAAAGEDIYVAKADSSGSLVWARGMKGSGFSEEGKALAQGPSGNIYVAGEFNGTVDFDPGPNSRELTPADARDAFVQKLTPGGALMWAKAIGGPQPDFATSLAVDPDGNIYVGGGFEDMADLDPGIGVDNVSANGGGDFFIAKLNSSGQYQWGYASGSAQGDDLLNSLVTDRNGNVYATGYFEGTVDFQPGPGNNRVTAEGGSQDIFLQKLDAEGASQWIVPIGGPGSDGPRDLALNQKGSLLLTGYFYGSVRFNPTTQVKAVDVTDVLMAQFSTSGNFEFARSIGSAGTDIGTGIAGNGQGDVFVTGSYRGDMSFGQGQFPFLLTHAGSSDIFTLRLTKCLDTTLSRNGQELRANQATGTYQWLSCGDSLQPVAGARQQTFRPDSNGRYAVALSAGSCQDTSACYTVRTVGQPGARVAGDVALYPQPAQDKLTIQAPEAYIGSRYQLHALDGQMLQSGIMRNPGATTLSVKQLPEGLYLLALQHADARTVRKVVIQ